MKETFKPLLDRVVVKRLPISEGGLMIPDKFAEQKDRGRILAVGPGRTGVPMTLKVGDKVLLDRNAPATTVKINDEDVLVLYEAEISGIITEPTE
jgi:chaperonin GroES